MLDPNNDADYLTAELNDTAATMAAGVCPLCECPLNPTHPKWAGQFDTRRVRRNGVTVTEPWSAEQEAAYLGPVLSWANYHVSCAKDEGICD